MRKEFKITSIRQVGGKSQLDDTVSALIADDEKLAKAVAEFIQERMDPTIRIQLSYKEHGVIDINRDVKVVADDR